MKKSIIISLLIIVSFNAILMAQNPLLTPARNKVEDNVRSIKYPVPIQKLLSKINNLQITLNKNMTKLFNDIEEDKSKKALILIFIVAFLYGVLHAAGPGHGKVMIASYFMTERAKIVNGFIAGGMIGFIHTVSAVIVVTILYLIIKVSYLSNIENISIIVKSVSALLIIGIGIFLLIKAIHKISMGKGIEIFTDSKEANSNKSLLILCSSIGIVPCPGVTIILLFAINKNVLPVGLVAIVFMSLGMAFTISLAAIITITARKYVFNFIQKKPRIYNILEFSIHVLGAIFIIIFGILLFLSNVVKVL